MDERSRRVLKELAIYVIGGLAVLGVGTLLSKSMHNYTANQYQSSASFREQFNKGFRLTHPNASVSDISNMVQQSYNNIKE